MFYKERKTIEKLLINCTLERTFLCLKPDGVQRGLLGKVLSKFEDRGYKLVGLKNLWASRELLEEHYAEHKGKPFFEKIIKYMSSGPVVAMVWEGTNIVQIGRKMLGATKPQESDIETIRGEYGIDVGRNIIHGSDSLESAKREIALWFKPEDLAEWSSIKSKWVYE